MKSASLAKNFLFLMASNVLSPLFSMVLVLAITRLRGVEMLGKYSLIMTVFVVGQACATLGFSIIITREVAKAPRLAGHYYLNACALTVALIALALLALIPGMWAITDEPEMRLAMTFTLLSLLPSVLMAHGESVLLAFGRAADYVTVGLAENVARASAGALLVFAGHGVAAIAAALLALRILAGIVLVLLLRHRGISLAARFDRGLWRELLAQVPVVGSIPIVNQIYARSDILLLTYLGSWRDVGLYSAGLRLVDLARTLPPAYAKAIYPILSRLHGHEHEEFAVVARRSLRQSLVMVMPLVVVLCGSAGPLIAVFYGADASGGAVSLAILAWSLIPLTVSIVLAQVLFAAGRQAVDLRTNLIATLFTVPANLLLIPRFGATGAAIAMLASMTAYATLQYVWTRQYVLDPGALDELAKVTLVILIGVAVTSVLLASNPVVAVVAGVSANAAAAIALGLVTRQELEGLRSRLGALGASRLWGVR